MTNWSLTPVNLSEVANIDSTNSTNWHFKQVTFNERFFPVSDTERYFIDLFRVRHADRIYIFYNNRFNDPGKTQDRRNHLPRWSYFISYAASCPSYETDMKTLDTKDEIWHKMYV